MALRKIVYEGDDILRKNVKPVKDFDERLSMLIDDMFDTLKEYNGVGLAAPQVGILKSVIVINTGDEGNPDNIELVNPEIIETEGEVDDWEGCLSIPGFSGKVVRPRRVKVRAFNRHGEEIIVEGESIKARALCHEIDHLHGILYTDKASEITENE